MVDIAHKNLTGADLHEPKGVAAAPANCVYISNGAGSGVWSPISSISGAFGGKLFHIRDERSSGTNGDSLSLSTWNTRALNTEKADDLSITPSNNQLSLVAGTYNIEVCCVANFIGDNNNGSQALTHQLRWRNITDSNTTIIGMAIRWQVNDGGNVNKLDVNLLATLSGRFAIAGTKIFELQNWISGNLFNSPTYKGGKAVNSGEPEVYLDLRLWKTA